MKFILITALLAVSSAKVYSQDKFNLYHPEADAKKEISDAVNKAKTENKNVFVVIGGNWCGWCKLFNDLTTNDLEIKNFLKDYFVEVHVNYSKENKNEEVLAQLGFPQRFGFPVFVILDENGKRIHTQNSGYLEEGEGHSKKKVLEFLQQWTVAALNPVNYKVK